MRLSLLLLFIYLHINHNKTQLKMAKTGLLLVSNLSKVPDLLNNISKYVSHTLYISTQNTTLPALAQSEWINGIYHNATNVCDSLDVRVLIGNLKDSSLRSKIETFHSIDIVMIDSSNVFAGESRDFFRSFVIKLKNDFDVMKIDDIENVQNKLNTTMNTTDEQTYNYGALGGTFDRLHNGHKILLSESLLRVKKGLTVGVTDINMIKSKKLWELIEPLNIRINNLKLFLKDVDPTLNYNVVPIQDVYGPTKDDPNLELLIVSQETVKGGELVNKKRLEKNLNPMSVHTINLASEFRRESKEEEEKISSSNKRMKLLGTFIKEPQENLKINPSPYVIGLTGGIASGKTNITEKLRSLGAGIVNCDLLAHELYKPGSPMNMSIAKVFGNDIITPEGEVDRKKLGSIVFNDPSRLIELNNLMWPAILDAAKKRVEELGREGYKIVVMEAAVLIQAGWQNSCHQVWTSIIPPEEAVKRMIERNKLTEEAAKSRLSSQPSNSEQVAAANVVFSSLWSYEFTQSQVVKAWKNLLNYLDAKRNAQSKI